MAPSVQPAGSTDMRMRPGPPSPPSAPQEAKIAIVAPVETKAEEPPAKTGDATIVSLDQFRKK